MLSMMGRMLLPRLLSSYSVCGGTSGNTVRVIRPSFSMARRLSVSTFSLMPGMARLSSPKRNGFSISCWMMKIFHLLPMSMSVVATGQGGNSSLVNIGAPILTKR